MKKTELNSGWSLRYAHHSLVRKNGFSFSDRRSLQASDLPCVQAKVPGNFELDLFRAGIIEDPFFGGNIEKERELESLHLWYDTVFDFTDDGGEAYLRFDGIDTAAEIYLNGVRLGFVENMLVEHEFRADCLKPVGNELVVHILPSTIYGRQFPLPPMCNAMHYEMASLPLRKAASTFGWDIIPRTVSGGIWKPVWLLSKQTERLEEVYLYTVGIDHAKKTGEVNFYYHIETDADNLEGLLLHIEGCCGDSVFAAQTRLWHTCDTLPLHIENCRYWYPKNAGDPSLYRVRIRLERDGTVVDEQTVLFGVRTVELRRTSVEDGSEEADFCFLVNGKRVFWMGSNWVPLDAFHSRDIENLPRALTLLDEIGCNSLRLWGGNVYENDAFYDWCDAHGILLWQDFGMGCAVYPQDARMQNLLREEARKVICRLRNHPALVLWAGDNECDYAYSWNRVMRDPNRNRLTRVILQEAVETYDVVRPYLPSSPYFDEKAVSTGLLTTEDHLWGPRDYFKGDFYQGSLCHFASETGYHGCPSPASLSSFIRKEQLWPIFDRNGVPGSDWILHGTSPDADPNGMFSYRTGLMANQVRVLFGDLPDNLPDFCRMSQISQAEAVKYFIERFRLRKWRRTGIIWWNLIDGWPQVSDAVVDYYGRKKLAFHYIRRSQQPVCMMYDEPVDGMCGLYAVNDTPESVHIAYTVTEPLTGAVLAQGEATVPGDTSVCVAKTPVQTGEKSFRLIRWTGDGVDGYNHYVTNLIAVDYARYTEAIRLCGMDCFEGFDA